MTSDRSYNLVIDKKINATSNRIHVSHPWCSFSIQRLLCFPIAEYTNFSVVI